MACKNVLRYKMKYMRCVSGFLPLLTSRRDINVSHIVCDSKGSHQNSFLPFWKPGSGHYGNTIGEITKHTVSSSEDLVLSVVDTIKVNPNGVFTVADYGTNDGYASMSLMNSIIGLLRGKYGEHLQIQVIYEDQEKNDFNSLFKWLSDDRSYMSKFSNVYPFATNRGFYNRCVPDGTCDVIFTNMAVHWFENVDIHLKDSVFHFLSASKEELRRLQLKAEQDWNKFLLHRASELKSGLLVAFSCVAVDQIKPCNPEEISFKKPNCPSTDQIVDFTVDSLGKNELDIYGDIDGAWRELLNENVITQEEFEACTVNLYLRTAKEITSPFQAADSPVTAAGLQLVHHDLVVCPHSVTVSWCEKLQKEGVDDWKTFAAQLVKAARVATQSLFEDSLSDARTAQENAAIVDYLYKVMEDRVSKRDPRSYKNDIIMSRLVARKV